MTPEEVDRAVQFLFAQQVQFASDFQQFRELEDSRHGHTNEEVAGLTSVVGDSVGLVSQLARVIGPLAGAVDQMAGTMGQMVGAMGQMVGTMDQMVGTMGQMAGAVHRLGGTVEQLAARHEALSDAQKETENRLQILIDVVDKYFRDRTNGGPH